jgi:hypothetical protein
VTRTPPSFVRRVVRSTWQGGFTGPQESRPELARECADAAWRKRTGIDHQASSIVTTGLTTAFMAEAV